jgi:CRP-like cAMP-binding protein
MVSVQVLKEFGVFEGVDDSQLAKIGEICHERTLNEGALCFSQGRKATELHLCRSGKVYTLAKVYDMEVTVHTVQSGEVFGWSALVAPYVYTASAKCAGKVEEIYMKRADLLNLFERDPLTGYIVMRNLSALVSSRLKETADKLAREIAAASDAHRDREW